MRSLAQRHPALFSGAWFTGSALLLFSPLGAMVLLYVALELLAGRPMTVSMGLFLASAALPLISTFGTGALVGPPILRLRPDRRIRAAAWGALAALGALLLWMLLLELLPGLSVSGTQAAAGGGDVPGAAVAVGYLVLLPLIVGVSLLAGGTAGLLLHLLAVPAGQLEKANPGLTSGADDG